MLILPFTYTVDWWETTYAFWKAWSPITHGLATERQPSRGRSIDSSLWRASGRRTRDEDEDDDVAISLVGYRRRWRVEAMTLLARPGSNTTDDIIAELGFRDEIAGVRDIIDGWLKESSSTMRGVLKWQFGGKSKYFRPLTIFSCHRAMDDGVIPRNILRSAAVLEMMHNVSLIIDDILDASSERRGKATLHCKFGLLPALMASGYIAADGYRMSAEDPYDVALFSDLLKRLGVAECVQWKLRREPLGVDDWLKIAEEDTGSMFETCACLATRDDTLREYGRLLGVLYHGCDDVADVKGLESLGGGGDEDLRDGILTLPASLAIRDAGVAALFCRSNPSDEDLAQIAAAMRHALPEAEDYLDTLSLAAKRRRSAVRRTRLLLALIDHARELSRRLTAQASSSSRSAFASCRSRVARPR
jgi:geranylgeranyl pyrophosphate synthase